jgi:hypothetical protein
MSLHRILVPALLASAASLFGCPVAPPVDGGAGGFSNSTDKTNANARYVGSNACRQCHSQIGEWQGTHGHAFELSAVGGGAPEFPAQGTRAGVPNPPEGLDWTEISYVIGGYTKKARFIDQNGFILTTGDLGIATQWNLSFPPNGTTPGFVDDQDDRAAPQPYDFSCFQCHTTGAQPQDQDDPQFQENRAGFAGTWAEPGVQCEACHGPGSRHFGTVGSEVVINTQRIFVDPDGSDSCRQCHNRPFGDQSGTILAGGGFIMHYEQWPELQASGGHAAFACTVCHDPHRSVIYDRANAIRNECTVCHADATMAGHEGKVYTRGDYSETLSCASCHMPYATRNATNASASVVGDSGRMGDTRTHIVRIDARNVDHNTFFNDDGTAVRLDENGQAAVTVDFVCLRCHNDIGSAFELSVERASDIAGNVHELP